MRIANRLLLSGNEAVALAARAAGVVPDTGYVYETLRDLECIVPGETPMLDFDMQRRHPVVHSSSFMPKCQCLERSGSFEKSF